MPALIEALKDEEGFVPENAALALGRIGPQAKAAVPALIEALKDDKSEIRRNATQALGRIGPDAVPALIEALKNENEHVREHAAQALESIGPEAKAAVPALIEALKGEECVLPPPALAALGSIGPQAKAAVPILIEALRDGHMLVRRAAAKVLGRIGAQAKAAVPALSEALKDKDNLVRRNAAAALGTIAEGLQDRKDTASLPNLENALLALTTAESAEDKVKPVRLAVEALRAMDAVDRDRWYKKLLRWAQRHPWIPGIAIVELGLFAAWAILLCFWPLRLLIINEGLDAIFSEKMKVKYKGFEGSAPVKVLLLVGFFQYHRRVLDAWVAKHIDTARKNFNKKETVALRQTHVPVPVVLDDNSLPSIGPEQLRATCKKHRWSVLISGEGGAGKTSLACQMARWAMADDKAKRLCEHHLLPVLIEHELDLTVDNPRHRFREAIRGQLQDLAGEAVTISPGLLAGLLRKQRVMVIVDHLSEMNEDTRKAMRPGDPEFLPYALVVTSRSDEKLDGLAKTSIKPRRIDGNRLSSFMESYLTQLGKRELLDDEEFFDICRKLSRMVAERDITVLLAKLYADQMVSVVEGADDSTLPDNIPDLMLQYLKILNRDRSEDAPDNPTVQKVAKIVGWECLRRTYRPGPGMRADILRSLKGSDNAEKNLAYLERSLRLIRTAGVSDEKVLFELDPLAEYLAGLHLVELHGDNEEHWRAFFSQADAQPDAPESIRGFLLAVRDCCFAKNKETDGGIPDFVQDELRKRAGLNEETLHQVRLKQRIDRLINNLKLPDADDRRSAAESLGRIGPKAKAAGSALIEALKDEHREVRGHAAEALGRIDPEASTAVPALIEALKDQDRGVSGRAAEALGRIGPEAVAAVPALIEALKGDTEYFGWQAAEALGKIGPEAKAAVRTLGEALKAENKYVREAAAEALGRIGPEARNAVPALGEALKDPDEDVRWKAAEALAKMGEAARAAIPALIEAFNDEFDPIHSEAAAALGNIGSEIVSVLVEALSDAREKIRRGAAHALGYIGPEAKAAVPALIKTLKDDSAWWVRRQAADTLGYIGPEAKEALPAIIEAVNDTEPTVRWGAANALAYFGPDAEAAVPALMEALKDEDKSIRPKAAEALGYIGPGAKDAIHALIKALKDVSVREAATEALLRIGGDTNDAK